MNTFTKILIAIAVLVAAFAVGRYTAPEKVKIETKVVEIEKQVVVHDTTTKKKVTHIVITHPDGTKEETTITEDITKEKDKTSNTHEDKQETVKEETKSSSKLTLSALAGVHVSSSPDLVYGGMVSKQVLGPISIGLWGLTDKSVGASVGVSF